jgi:hypothetical protein
MRARIAENLNGLFVLALALLLTGCSGVGSVSEFVGVKSYHHKNVALMPENRFIQEQYDALFHGDMDIVVNKPIDLCPYNKLLFVRVSNHSTWLTDPVRNSVMRAFHRRNRFFQDIKTSEPIAYINAKPYPGIPINEDDVLWYSENDPVTFAWLHRFLKEDKYLIADAILNETNIDAGLLRDYSFELKLVDSEDGAVIVEFINIRASLNKKPEGVISNTIQRVNGWLERVEQLCAARAVAQVPPEPENCGYEK